MFCPIQHRVVLGRADSRRVFGEALAGLGIAFDTTVVALSLSVFAMLLASYVRKMEDDQVTEAEIFIRRLIKV